MYLTIIAFVLALVFPVLPLAQAQTPDQPKASCCQMQTDHSAHKDHAKPMACCAEMASDAGKSCKDGKCADCCSDGECTDCCKDASCCKHEKASDDKTSGGCCQKAAPKN
jgi:hypothetical protein